MMLVAIHSLVVSTAAGVAAIGAGDDVRGYPWHLPSWTRQIEPGETFDTAANYIGDDEAGRLVTEGYARLAPGS